MLHAVDRLAWLLAAVVLVGCTGAASVAPSPAPTTTAATTPGPASELARLPSPSPSPPRQKLEEVTLELDLVTSGLDQPVNVATAPGDARLFISEKRGRVKIFAADHLLDAPFLDLRNKVLAGGERGLLGLAFHPDFGTNGRFFVYYTAVPDGDNRLEEYRVSDDPDRARSRPAGRLLNLADPDPVHNGGTLAFGPDGMLYLGLGDGGPGEDPRATGQDPSDLFGSLLRFDVDGGDPDSVPPDNPFADGGDGEPLVWAYGLRNPWRFAFDNGRLYLADVGQYAVEEINVVDASRPGLNYGWSRREGDRCFPSGGTECRTKGLVRPLVTYDHGENACAVIGGAVYRGDALPALVGHYFYSDYCGGWLRSFHYRNGRPTARRNWTEQVGRLANPTWVGDPGDGEIYVTIPGSTASQDLDGEIYRLAPGD